MVTRWLVFIGLMLVFSSTLHSAEQKPLPKSVVLTELLTKYIPSLLPVKQIIELAYERLGIEVEWVELPSMRALKYSNEGRFDGEMIRASSVVNSGYDELLQVPTKLLDVEIRMYCLTATKCGDIYNKNLIVGHNVHIKFYDLLCRKHKFQCNSFYPYQQALTPLIQGKVDAIMSTPFELFGSINEMSPMIYQSDLIVKIDAFHYLHKRLAHLIPKLTAELTKMEKEGLKPDIAKQAIQALEKTNKIVPVY